MDAKWKTQPASTGVQRYAQGLTDAVQRAGLPIELAIPGTRGRVAGTYWEQRILPELARGADVLFCPANAAPISLAPNVRLVVVIHCLRYLTHPESYSPLFVRWYKHMIPRVIARADRVLSVSQVECDEIAREFPDVIGKLGLLPPGLDPAFRPDRDRAPQAPSMPYITCISNATSTKNLATIVGALERIIFPLKLVAIGVTSQELDIICPSGVREKVIALGHIEDQDLIASWVSNAIVHVSPSRYESFGLPCLEAMGCGTPVIASDIPAHREVCDDAAIFVNPENPGAWADAMTELCTSPVRRDELSKRGLERSHVFRWDRTADLFRHEIDLAMGRLVT